MSLRAEWQVGPGTFTSITAWRYWDWKPSNDRDFIGLPITTVSANPSQQDQWTQELRYAATIGHVDFVVGAFAFDQSLHTQGRQVQGAAASRWLLNPGNVPPGSSACNPPTANACNPAVLNGLTSTNTIDFSNTSVAAFGQLTWHVTDRLSLQPGMRINYDNKSGSYVAIGDDRDGQHRRSTATSAASSRRKATARASAPGTSPEISPPPIDVARDVLAYATFARAFKSGGINLSGLPLDAANNPILSAATVRPETVNHYELGPQDPVLEPAADLQPRRLLDRRLRLSGDRHQRPARRAARLSRQCRPGPRARHRGWNFRAGRPTISISM